MSQIGQGDLVVGKDDLVLVTGAAGFIGSRVVASLLDRGLRNLRCLTRPSSDVTRVQALAANCRTVANVEVVRGNLLSREDCAAVTRDVAVVFHLAAGRGEKSFADAFLNSVVTTRNLLDGCIQHRCLRRFVNVSSFVVYSNMHKPGGRLLDETSPVYVSPERQGNAYCFAKTKQDELVRRYGERFGIPFVIVRPGYVYGPGNEAITGRVGISTFGGFLHLGGSNTIPFSYVDNCAEAIVLAGLKAGVNREVFNVVDDDLPSSRQFLRQYKRKVRHFRSIYLPHAVSYALCFLWERYSAWSEGQLPPAFNREIWHASWKKSRYSNEKLKTRLGWMPKVSTEEGLRRYFEACQRRQHYA